MTVCEKCGEDFKGFGTVCSACRRSGLKSQGTARACMGCGEFFSGFGNMCEDCVAAGKVSLGSGPYRARFQQTMLRIKDPKKSVPFYCDMFGMKLIHWIEFPQWTFTVYFVQVLEDGQDAPPCTLEKTSVECERYLHTMNGTALELTHNHGAEKDDSLKFHSGNTGADADGDLKADQPKFRGFGHIAFNCDDVYAATELLLSKGVEFRKKPDEGRMKGLAFCLDPDGYWIELVKRQEGLFKSYFNFSQVMMRVKDGPASIKFYQQHFGMTLINVMQADTFSNFYLASVTPAELKSAMQKDADCQDQTELDPYKPNNLGRILWNQCVELTWNHGTENNPDFKVHNGNDQPQGFGHIGFLMDNLEDACEKMEANGAVFKKKPADGNMRNIGFVYDPDGYWVELVDRKAGFSGVCSNY